MNHLSARGVNRHGIDATFEADEAHKSQLMLEAQLLRAQQQFEAAADKFAEAAVIEERLRDVCFAQGLRDKAFVHGSRAASCWAQAGDFHHAIRLCNDLLEHIVELYFKLITWIPTRQDDPGGQVCLEAITRVRLGSTSITHYRSDSHGLIRRLGIARSHPQKQGYGGVNSLLGCRTDTALTIPALLLQYEAYVDDNG